MTTNSSDLAPTALAIDRGAEKEALAHLWRYESQPMIQLLILELSVRISRRAAHLATSSNDLAHCSEDMAALAWVQQSLEDVEATLIGLSAVHRRDGGKFQGPEPSSDGTRFPSFGGANPRRDQGPR